MYMQDWVSRLDAFLQFNALDFLDIPEDERDKYRAYLNRAKDDGKE